MNENVMDTMDIIEMMYLKEADEKDKRDKENEEDRENKEDKDGSTNEIEHNVLTMERYVIANFDEETKYLRMLGDRKYLLTNTIDYASKTLNRLNAKHLIDFYRLDTGDMQDLVILPIRVKYYLIEKVDS